MFCYAQRINASSNMREHVIVLKCAAMIVMAKISQYVLVQNTTIIRHFRRISTVTASYKPSIVTEIGVNTHFYPFIRISVPNSLVNSKKNFYLPSLANEFVRKYDGKCAGYPHPGLILHGKWPQ